MYNKSRSKYESVLGRIIRIVCYNYLSCNCCFFSDLTPASEEILFEVYEGMLSSSQHEQHRFLGLAIVGFDEIRRSGEAIHSLTLQGRPYRNDTVSGTLTVQV